MTLYKYLTADRSDIIETGHIRYTQPIFLNDPFEMTPDFSEILSEKLLLRYVKRKMFRQTIDEVIAKLPENVRLRARILAWIFVVIRGPRIRQNIRTMAAALMAKMRVEASDLIESKLRSGVGVLSLTERSDNLQMWSHYADNHTGFIIAIDEKHPVFSERRSDNDEFNHLRKVVYAQKKPKPSFDTISGVDLLLSKSTEWEHEREWRIVKLLDSATAMAMVPDHGVYLFALPPDAVEGIILGAHMPECERRRIMQLVHSKPELSHIWMKQAEVSRTEFELKFFELPHYADHFPDPIAQFRFENVVERKQTEIVETVNLVGSISARQPLNLSRLKTIWITPDVRETVSKLIQQPIGGNVDGQVFGLSTGGNVDVDMFLAEGLFKERATASQEEAEMLVHKIHRQFASVHNLTMRFHALGEKTLTETKPGIAGYLGPVAFNVWNDYATSRLSVTTYPNSECLKILPNLSRLQFTCSRDVTIAIDHYREHHNLDLLMQIAAVQIQEFACAMSSAFGYADGLENDLGKMIEKAVIAAGGKSYEVVVRDLSRSLRRMFRYYPAWTDFSIYEDLMHVVRMIALQWRLPMRDLGKRIHVAVV